MESPSLGLGDENYQYSYKRPRILEPSETPSANAANEIRGSIIDNYYAQLGDDEYSPGEIKASSLFDEGMSDFLCPFPSAAVAQQSSIGLEPPPDISSAVSEMKFNRDAGYEAGRLICLTLRLNTTEPLELQLAPSQDVEKGNYYGIFLAILLFHFTFILLFLFIRYIR